MDGYFTVAPTPVMVHAPYAPEVAARGNRYIPNPRLSSFWSVRGLWLEERWPAQSEVAIASPVAQVQPVYIPYESTMIPVVMISL